MDPQPFKPPHHAANPRPERVPQFQPPHPQFQEAARRSSEGAAAWSTRVTV